METKAQYVLARQNNQSVQFELIEKQLAHIRGLQHYAFSIFIFNSDSKLLLQRRALDKYHSPGLWTNTCCSHPLSPKLDEIKQFANDRLLEEMGISTTLNYLFTFEYRVHCGQLIENEIDYVFSGYSDAPPAINQDEVAEYRYVGLDELKSDVLSNPEKYTEWLKIILRDNYLELLAASRVKAA